MNPLTFVTVCMNRLDFLRQTLGILAAQPDCSTVLVDWSCPQHAGDWAEEHHSTVTVHRVPGQATMNIGAARNVGARLVRTPWTCFIDADIVLDPRFAAVVLPQLQAGHFYRPHPESRGIIGTWLVETAAYARAGGYDEVLRGYGEDDYDAFDAMTFAGLQCSRYPAVLLSHLHHDDTLRTENFENKERVKSILTNMVYRLVKWELARSRGPLDAAERRRLYDGLFVRVPAALVPDPATGGYTLSHLLEVALAELQGVTGRAAGEEVRERFRAAILRKD